MIALLNRMDEGFEPSNDARGTGPHWVTLTRLARHGLIRGEVDWPTRRVGYRRATPHPTDYRLGCIPKHDWPTVEPGV